MTDMKLLHMKAIEMMYGAPAISLEQLLRRFLCKKSIQQKLFISIDEKDYISDLKKQMCSNTCALFAIIRIELIRYRVKKNKVLYAFSWFMKRKRPETISNICYLFLLYLYVYPK